MAKPRKKNWTKSFGSYGSTVRVAELTPDGILYLLWVGKDRRQRKRSLRHRDKKRGQETAQELALRLSKYRDQVEAGELTIGPLIDKFMEQGLSGRSRKHCEEMARKLGLWKTFLGVERPVGKLSPSDVERFVASRRAGTLRPSLSRSSSRPSQTTIWHDVVALKTALNFAVRQYDAAGNVLLAANPLSRVRVAKTVSPAQPVADEARDFQLKSVAAAVNPQFELALDLAWSTGHRIGAILGLRWSDVHLVAGPLSPFGTVHWRAENDKISNDHVVPLTEIARDALQLAARTEPRIGDSWIFPSAFDQSKPTDRHLAGRWLQKAERLAGVTHMNGGGWHAFRRGWASARKDIPDVDVAAAGGWKNTVKMKRSYQKADPHGLLRAVTVPRRGNAERNVSTELCQGQDEEKLRSA